MPEITNKKTGVKYNVTKAGLEQIKGNKEMVGLYDYDDDVKTPPEAEKVNGTKEHSSAANKGK